MTHLETACDVKIEMFLVLFL